MTQSVRGVYQSSVEPLFHPSLTHVTLNSNTNTGTSAWYHCIRSLSYRGGSDDFGHCHLGNWILAFSNAKSQIGFELSGVHAYDEWFGCVSHQCESSERQGVGCEWILFRVEHGEHEMYVVMYRDQSSVVSNSLKHQNRYADISDREQRHELELQSHCRL